MKMTDTEKTKRMAEGAAGEAAPQDFPRPLTQRMVQAEGKFSGQIADLRKHGLNAHAKIMEEEFAAVLTEWQMSGSASTAGPRAECPKCGNNFFDVRAGTAYCCDTALLTGCNYQGPVARFFAAAPAEDAKEK